MEKLLSGFDPESNHIDRRILYEITGRKVSPNDHYTNSIGEWSVTSKSDSGDDLVDQEILEDNSIKEMRRLSDVTA